MEAKCKNCEKEFKYNPSQKGGIFCSWKCSGEYQLKQRFQIGIEWNKRMGTYLKEIRGNKCEVCGITEHNAKPIVFQIDHISGDRMDNRHENLKVICPNCHSQTPTFGNRNLTGEAYEKMLAGAIKGGNIRKKAS